MNCKSYTMLILASFITSGLNASGGTLTIAAGDEKNFKDFHYSEVNGKDFKGQFPKNSDGKDNITCEKDDKDVTVSGFNFTYDDSSKAAKLKVSNAMTSGTYKDCVVLGEGSVTVNSNLPETIIVK